MPPRWRAKILVLLVISNMVQANCPWEALASLPFSLEYALWRGWQQAVIYSPNIEPDCEWATVRLVKCLSVNGVGTSVNSNKGAPLHTKLGVLILAPHLKNNGTNHLGDLIKELLQLQMGTASYDWLITTRSDKDIKHINRILNGTSIRFDQNLVVVYPTKKNRSEIPLYGLCENNFRYRKINPDPNIKSPEMNCKENYYGKNCYRRLEERVKTDSNNGYFRSTVRFKNLSRNLNYTRQGYVYPLYNSGLISYNYSKTFQMVNMSRLSLPHHYKSQFSSKFVNVSRNSTAAVVMIVVQYFKVRINSTLYGNFLGAWSKDWSMSYVEVPYPVEARNFLGEELVVGRCNSSEGAGGLSLEDEGPSAPSSMDDVLHFLTVRLNTTSSTRFFSKLGYRTYEGSWTGLLGALIDNTVDIALEPVTAHSARRQDMEFLFPIAETMCNIYIRQQETSTVRDIFLAPFSGWLVACVVAVAIAAAAVVVAISKLAPAVGNQPRRMGYTEAVIWSTGILCQQGGTWTPPNPSASVLLIVCLFFAVVTYNAYAAFITSVLSVRVASVDTVTAVLQAPHFKIGYIKNGADQMYLMSTKDAQLNAFYIRGYSEAENLVSSAEDGLARAASQDYAFFAGQRAARITLRSMSQARGRCAVREVPVYSTRAHLAFPLPRDSPYARPTLLSLLQLRSSGSLARLEAALVPDMPQCAPPAGFASARASDVRSALLLLLVGYIAALLIGIAEFSWNNRKQLVLWLTKCYQRLLNLISKL